MHNVGKAVSNDSGSAYPSASANLVLSACLVECIDLHLQLGCHTYKYLHGKTCL